MDNERLVIKNFGPIREADIDLRKVTVFIGEQASGKSVLAKLVAIIRSPDLLQTQIPKDNFVNVKFNEIKDRAEFYNIVDFFSTDSKIDFVGKDYNFVISDNNIELQFKDIELKGLIEQTMEAEKKDKQLERSGIRAFRANNFEKSADVSAERKITHKNLVSFKSDLNKKTFETEYIPAERLLVSLDVFNNSIEYLNFFEQSFSEKRRMKKNFSIDALKMQFEFNPKSKESSVKLENGLTHSLLIASNGVQSLVPIIVTLETINPLSNYLFIIEEPELNLYPSTQKKLVEYLIEKCTKGNNRLVITTHSPYILTALNNCIQASNVVKLRPETKTAVNGILPEQYQIDYEDVMAYFVGGGTARPIMNDEYQTISANELDGISDEIGATFDQLLDLKYQD